MHQQHYDDEASLMKSSQYCCHHSQTPLSINIINVQRQKHIDFLNIQSPGSGSNKPQLFYQVIDNISNSQISFENVNQLTQILMHIKVYSNSAKNIQEQSFDLNLINQQLDLFLNSLQRAFDDDQESMVMFDLDLSQACNQLFNQMAMQQQMFAPLLDAYFELRHQLTQRYMMLFIRKKHLAQQIKKHCSAQFSTKAPKVKLIKSYNDDIMQSFISDFTKISIAQQFHLNLFGFPDNENKHKQKHDADDSSGRQTPTFRLLQDQGEETDKFLNDQGRIDLYK